MTNQDRDPRDAMAIRVGDRAADAPAARTVTNGVHQAGRVPAIAIRRVPRPHAPDGMNMTTAPGHGAMIPMIRAAHRGHGAIAMSLEVAHGRGAMMMTHEAVADRGAMTTILEVAHGRVGWMMNAHVRAAVILTSRGAVHGHEAMMMSRRAGREATTMIRAVRVPGGMNMTTPADRAAMNMTSRDDHGRAIRMMAMRAWGAASITR